MLSELVRSLSEFESKYRSQPTKKQSSAPCTHPSNLTTHTSNATETENLDNTCTNLVLLENSLKPGEHSAWYYLLIPALIFFIIIHYVWEFFQMYSLKIGYLKDFENYFEMGLLLFASITVSYGENIRNVSDDVRCDWNWEDVNPALVRGRVGNGDFQNVNLRIHN